MDFPNFISFCDNFPTYISDILSKIKFKLLNGEELDSDEVIILQKLFIYFRYVCEKNN